jgi:hypothetical protein
MVSGWERSQETNRKPVPMNCSFVVGIAARVSRIRSQGSSRWVRTATPIQVDEA